MHRGCSATKSQGEEAPPTGTLPASAQEAPGHGDTGPSSRAEAAVPQPRPVASSSEEGPVCSLTWRLH